MPVLGKLRVLRDHKLAETDWVLLPDSGFTDEQRQSFVVYRQALRDIPEEGVTIATVIWPDLPFPLQKPQ